MAIDPTLAAFLTGSGAATSGPDINNFIKTAGANDVYNQIAGPILGAKFNSSTWTPMQSGLTSAIQTFLGTVLSGLGNQDVTNQLSKVAQVMPTLQAHPEQVGIPDGVDPTAFNALKIAAMNKNDTTAQEIKKALAINEGVNYDPSTGTVTPITDQSGIGNVFTTKDNTAAIAKAANAKASPLNAKLTQNMTDIASAIGQINSAQDLVSKFPGGDGWLGGTENALLAASPLGIGANSLPAQYQRQLPTLAQIISKANSGSPRLSAGNGANKSTILGALSQAPGEGSSTLLDALGSPKASLLDEYQNNINSLKDAGYPQSAIDNYTQALEGLKNGTTMDHSWLTPQATASSDPAAPFRAAAQSGDKATFASLAQSSGMTLDQANAAWAALGGTDGGS